MSAIDRARELGAEHGKAAGAEWINARPAILASQWRRETLAHQLTSDKATARPSGLPEPDLLTGNGTFAAVCQADLDAYCTAFRTARDETIREAIR